MSKFPPKTVLWNLLPPGRFVIILKAHTVMFLVYFFQFEVEMEDNWYEAAVSAVAPHRIISVVDWASDAPIPSPEEPRKPASYNVYAWGVNDPSDGERTLEKENFEYFYRQRLGFNMRRQDTGDKVSKLVLNEVFASEKDVGKISIYRLNVDGKNLGKFKSSGMLAATGTGSSGWLQSAKRIPSSDVRKVLNYLGTNENLDLVITYSPHIAAYR